MRGFISSLLPTSNLTTLRTTVSACCDVYPPEDLSGWGRVDGAVDEDLGQEMPGAAPVLRARPGIGPHLGSAQDRGPAACGQSQVSGPPAISSVYSISCTVSMEASCMLQAQGSGSPPLPTTHCQAGSSGSV